MHTARGAPSVIVLDVRLRKLCNFAKVGHRMGNQNFLSRAHPLFRMPRMSLHRVILLARRLRLTCFLNGN
jgi:hypothetical protein